MNCRNYVPGGSLAPRPLVCKQRTLVLQGASGLLQPHSVRMPRLRVDHRMIYLHPLSTVSGRRSFLTACARFSTAAASLDALRSSNATPSSRAKISLIFIEIGSPFTCENSLFQSKVFLFLKKVRNFSGSFRWSHGPEVLTANRQTQLQVLRWGGCGGNGVTRQRWRWRLLALHRLS